MGIHSIEALSNAALQNRTNTVTGKKNSLSFPEIFLAVRGANKKSETNALSVAFPTNDVSIKVGDCDVDTQIWQRKDFPAWRYFQEDATADCLNHWKPRGKSTTKKETYIQSELKKIGSGKLVALMPESLQKKMGADPGFAREIAEKLQDWKISYDKMDNALAVSYGENPISYQMTKSYCLQLDEKGNVKNYMVVSGGMDTRESAGGNKADMQTQILQNALVRAITQMTLQNGAANMMSNYGELGYTNLGAPGYANIAPYLFYS